jgi:hypothetical protein
LRVTPAMEAGIADYLWTIEGIAKLADQDRLLLTLRQIFEILFPRHPCCSHEPSDYIIVNFGVGGNDNRTQAPWLGVGFMAAFLALKNKAGFHKNAFENFPVDRRYAG